MIRFNLTIVIIVVTAALLFQILMPVTLGVVAAAGSGYSGTSLNPNDLGRGINLTWDKVIKILYGLTCWVFSLMESVLIIFLAWTAYKFMWARGSGEETSAAGKKLWYVLIGGVVIFGFGIIISTVAYYSGYLGGSTLKSMMPTVPGICLLIK